MTCAQLGWVLAAWLIGVPASAQFGRSEPLPPPRWAPYTRSELAPAPPGWLVTASEARAFKGEEGFDAQPALRARAVVPLIDILLPEPSPDQKVKAPFAINVQFRGQADSPIDPSTFKLLYGELKIDITSRITSFVKVTKDGFSLDQAHVPLGKHRLTLHVQDEKQRVAERELRLHVE